MVLYFCLGIYIVINVGVVVATLGKEIIVRVCGWRAADSLFKEMLHVIPVLLSISNTASVYCLLPLLLLLLLLFAGGVVCPDELLRHHPDGSNHQQVQQYHIPYRNTGD